MGHFTAPIATAGANPDRIAVRTAAENQISEYNEAILLLQKNA